MQGKGMAVHSLGGAQPHRMDRMRRSKEACMAHTAAAWYRPTRGLDKEVNGMAVCVCVCVSLAHTLISPPPLSHALASTHALRRLRRELHGEEAENEGGENDQVDVLRMNGTVPRAYQSEADQRVDGLLCGNLLSQLRSALLN